MNKKLLLVTVVILLVAAGVLIIQTQQIRDNRIVENSLEDCVEQEAQNLIINEYLLPSQLSVVFYTKPSVDLINILAKKYNLEIIQIYTEPNVVFRVNKKDAPTVKCQLQNESGIKQVSFIESRPLPAN